MIRKTIIVVLTLAAVGTIILWIASHFDDLRLETEAFDVAYQRLANARVATGEMKANRAADLFALLNRLGTTEEPLTEFQTLGWKDRLAGPIAGTVGVSDELLRVPLPVAGDQAFYRVLTSVEMDSEVNAAEAVFGYGTEFSLQLQELGQLPLEDFVSRYAVTDEYLAQITFPSAVAITGVPNGEGISTPVCTTSSKKTPP